MKRIYLFCAIVLSLLAIHDAVIHSFAHACIVYFRLWLGVMLLAWMHKLYPSALPARMMFVLYLLLIQPPALTPESMFALHWLAPAHILFSWSAGCCLWAMLSLPQDDQHAGLCHTALVYELAAIVTGMIWAMDAPDWGMLWQWDAVETGSLCILLSIYAISRSPSVFWRYLGLFLALYQIWSLYLMPAAQTRHSYTDAPVNAWVWYLSAACFAVIFIWQNRCSAPHNLAKLAKTQQIAQFTCGFVMLIVYVLSQFDLIDDIWLYLCFALIWYVLSIDHMSIRRVAIAVVGVCTILLPALPSPQPNQIWLNLTPPQSSLSLAGIRISDADDCKVYHATIQSDLHATEIAAKSCDHQMSPVGHRDIISSDGIQRLWLFDYQARFGVLLLQRDITIAVLYEIWLVVLWLLVLLHAAGILVPKQRPQRKLDQPQHNHR